MKAILVTCPHCGGRVQVVGASEEVRCEYCGTSSRVQRRTRVFERVLPPPAVGPKSIAVQRHNPKVLLGVIFSFTIPLVSAAVIGVMIKRNVDRATSAVATTTATQARRAEVPEWQGTDGVIVADVDGNGTLDLIGRSRRVQAGDVVKVIALDGATGKPLWESEPLGTYAETHLGTLARAGDQLLFASPRAEVRAFALATGAARWKTTLDDRVERFCDGGADAVIALGVDEVARPLRRADGAPAGTTAEAPAPGARGNPRAQPCAALPTDGRTAWVSDRRDHVLGSKHGVSFTELASGPGGRVLAGTRSKGTGVATLVALDDASEERWRVLIPKDPLGSLERSAPAVVVSDLEVCAAYYAESVTKPMRVACFALADGARLWDLEVGGRSLRALVPVGRALAVSSIAALELYDLPTGKVRWRFLR